VKAIRLHGPSEIRLDEIERPIPRAGEALIRVRAVGVCGSDIHVYKAGGVDGTQTMTPLVLGHEFAGEILALGPGTTGPTVGTRVAVDPAIPCGRCETCLDGNINCCPNVQFPSTPPLQGALAEYVVHPAHLCETLPSALSFADGAMLEPLGVAIHALSLARINPGDTVAVLGAGPIGLLCIQLALVSGAHSVYASEPIPERRTMAAAAGATAVCDSASIDPEGWLHEQTDGRGVDVVIEAAWGDQAVAHAVGMAKPAGRVVLVGISSRGITDFPAAPARRKGLTLLVSRRMQVVYPRAIALVERGRIDVRTLVTHRFPLEQTPEAFSLVAAIADGVGKAMIDIS
jgi:L-iditol 2-dehydrogenase